MRNFVRPFFIEHSQKRRAMFPVSSPLRPVLTTTQFRSANRSTNTSWNLISSSLPPPRTDALPHNGHCCCTSCCLPQTEPLLKHSSTQGTQRSYGSYPPHSISPLANTIHTIQTAQTVQTVPTVHTGRMLSTWWHDWPWDEQNFVHCRTTEHFTRYPLEGYVKYRLH